MSLISQALGPLLLALVILPAAAQQPPVHRCGTTISDRKCATEESPAERDARLDAAARQAEADRVAREAARADRTLILKYPNATAHGKVRDADLAPVRAGLVRSDENLAKLRAARKPLLLEAQFYEGKPLPAGLQRQFDANDAAIAAQHAAGQNYRDDVDRINARFDAQLARLQKLWAGLRP